MQASTNDLLKIIRQEPDPKAYMALIFGNKDRF